MKNSRIPGLLLACLFVSLASCGQPQPAGSPLVPITGTVEWKGEVLTDAMVHFTPTENTAGAGGTGRTNAKGVYKLTNVRGGAGVVAGEYKVIISRRILPNGLPIPENYNVGPMDSDARESLPMEYSDPDQTMLTANVSAGIPPIDFKLK